MMEQLEKAIAAIKEKMPELELRESEPMSEHCSFKLGGPVRAFAVPKDIWEFSKLEFILHMHSVAPLMIGKGTNMIIPDEGLEICVISTEKLNRIRLGEDGVTIHAEAGVSLASLAAFAKRNSLSGLEFASGIPGSVGGALLMNAGAYGGEMKDVTDSVVVYYLPEQALTEVAGRDCDFSYRHSAFENISCAILSAVFRLTPGAPEEIGVKMNEMNEKRRASQPLDMPSAGSAFKRPEGGYAAALIDEAGLKGFTVGGAMISTKHAGFAVNAGGASYDDVVELLDKVRRTVYEKSGITLTPEIRIYPKGMVLVDDWKQRRSGIMDQMAKSSQEKAEAQE